MKVSEMTEEQQKRKREYDKKYREKNKDKVRVRTQLWREQNREKFNATSRASYAKNPERYKANTRRYWQKHKEERNAYAREYWRANSVRRNQLSKKYRAERKQQVFEHYGNICNCCGETKTEFFTIDHINNDGAEHRRQNQKIRQGGIYIDIVRNDYPDTYQILCYNCNCAKGRHYSYDCPHKDSRLKSVSQSGESKRRTRIKVLEHYSKGQPKCVCCGETEIRFLTIDHIHGGGNKHLKEIKDLTSWLHRNKCPEGFQVLCYNCNGAKAVHGWCPHGKFV